jgi:glutaconate CoA-transferase subunit A
MAGAANLPFALLRGYAGSDLPKHNRTIRTVTCPFTGEQLAATPAIRPDTTFIHAQKADREGNVYLWGIVGVQKEAALAARRLVVTVEEVVERLDAPPNACILPAWVVSAVCVVPGGAHPSYAHGYYDRDNRFYQQWDDIARTRDGFLAFMRTHVLDTEDMAGFEAALRRSRARAP